MRNITNLSIPCNRYTLVMDLSQCLQRKLHDITSSDEVINATKLERIQNITESLTLLYRMAKLYDSVEVRLRCLFKLWIKQCTQEQCQMHTMYRHYNGAEF